MSVAMNRKYSFPTVVLRDSAKRHGALVVLEHLEQAHSDEEVYRVFAHLGALDNRLGLLDGYHLGKSR